VSFVSWQTFTSIGLSLNAQLGKLFGGGTSYQKFGFADFTEGFLG
jgi:hypothetical protein